MPKKKRKVKCVEVIENDFPSKEKIWDKQYECRNFELSSFWQKSAFLFCFLSLCFAGYGALVSHIVNKDTNPDSIPYIFQYMCGVSLLGIVLSILWIYLMKGSKAWYEVYEKSIYEIETEIFKGKNEKYIEGEFAKKMRKNYSNSFIGTSGGAFSPSKINIVIGWILLIVWCCCGIFSLYNLLYTLQLCKSQFTKSFNDDFWQVSIISVLAIIGISIITICIIKKFVKSKPLLMDEGKKYSRLKFCKYLFSKFTKWIISSFWTCALCTLLVAIFIFIRFFILILFIPVVCLVIFIATNLKIEYENFKKQEDNADILNKTDNIIYQTIRNYSIRTTKNKIENIVNKNLKDLDISGDIKTIINNVADDLMKDKINDCLDVIIDKYLKDKIKISMEKKLNDFTTEQINHILIALEKKDKQ